MMRVPVYFHFLHRVFRRLLFPAFVAPAITTCTPLRSRSPLLSSFRCRSISACRSHTDLSTWGGGETEERQDMTKVLHSTSLSRHCKRKFLGFEGKRHVLRCLTAVIWMKNGTQTGVYPHATKGEIYNTMHQQYIIFLTEETLNYLKVLTDEFIYST